MQNLQFPSEPRPQGPQASSDLADHAPVVVEGAEAELPHPEGQGDGEDYEESVRVLSAGEEEEEEEQERPREFAAKVGKAPSVSLKHRQTWQGWCLLCRFTTTPATKS